MQDNHGDRTGTEAKIAGICNVNELEVSRYQGNHWQLNHGVEQLYDW